MTGTQLKLRGISLAESARKSLVDEARTVAALLAMKYGTVTADDVRLGLMRIGASTDLGNAWGAVFRSGFEWTGEVKESTWPPNHCRLIRVWRLRDGS
jgi:hypothetical protein